jgi:hypothetical protein
MPVLAANRFLIKVPESRLDVARRVLPGRTGALFPEQGEDFRAKSTTGPPEWFLHEPVTDVRMPEHPWDAAHAIAESLARTLLEEGGARPYVEPDLLHRRYVQLADSREARAGQGIPWPALKGLIPDYRPKAGSKFSLAWHLDRSGFQDAWNISQGTGVRIAHPDTGYYPAHGSTPRHVFATEGYNYFDGNSDVTDPGNHLNAGHGTATLALLAGKEVNLEYSPVGSSVVYQYNGIIGGAPEASIVPIRIGGVFGSVVHVYSSSMAQGLHHALGDSRRAPCDVVSLSHGGLPTKPWVEAVNQLYDNGIILAAASGDSFSGCILDIPTHFTVYPSAWYRVITVTGETYSGAPYTTNHFMVMQGCWGPAKVMKKALGACTPNVPWMRLDSPTAWGMDGSGTSASAPQVAAACALWLAQYQSQLPRDWRRVAACRKALFAAVRDRGSNTDKIGVGALDAWKLVSNTAFSKTVVQDAKLQKPKLLTKIVEDQCSWPFLRLLFGLPPPGPGVDEMIEVEALQVAYRSQNPRLQKMMDSHPDGRGIPAPVADRLRKEFLREPDMSGTLRSHLIRHRGSPGSKSDGRRVVPKRSRK